MEHMLFKGTKKRPSAQKLSKVIDGIGAEWNASTGKESTAYYIKGAADHIATEFDILCDMVTGPLLDPREIEKEKNVIRAEIAMYEDTPARRVADLFETLLYPDSSLGWDIAGTPETVSGISRGDFDELYRGFYQPKNMVVVVAGGVKEKDVEQLTRRYLGNIRLQAPNSKQTQISNIKYQKEIFAQDEPKILVHEKKTDQAHLVLGFRGNPRGHKDRFTEEVLATILGGGMSSRLWIAVRERRGLAYYIRADVEHYRDNGYFAVCAGVDPKKIKEAISIILEEFKKVRRGKVSLEEIRRAKDFIKGHTALSLEDTRSVAGFFGSFELLENKIMTPDEVLRETEKVTKDDIVRVANEFFVQNRLNIAIIGPYTSQERFERLLASNF